MSLSRRTIINLKRTQVEKLDEVRYSILGEIDQLEKEDQRERHPCVCVRYNGDMGIGDMIQQEAAGRNGLGFGFVSQNYSAAKTCLLCQGTGKPTTND